MPVICEQHQHLATHFPPMKTEIVEILDTLSETLMYAFCAVIEIEPETVEMTDEQIDRNDAAFNNLPCQVCASQHAPLN